MAWIALAAPAQTIVWSSATGITGDANLLTNGTYFDALTPNTGVSPTPTVDGVTFNVATNQGGSTFGDGKISYAGSGLDNYSWPGSFPVSASASSAFATLMDDGGIFQNGGSGTGTVTISGLTVGHNYEVQVFNYAADGDAGLTTFSGTTAVTLSNLPGSGGTNTYGEYATGTFSASGATETFNWNGGGSGYTVLGAISVRDMTGTVSTNTQTVAWGTATGITGDANLLTNGTYFDALMPNTGVSPTPTVDGVTFNVAASQGSGAFGDGKISYAGSGLNNYSWPGSFPVSASASSAFATLMDDGGIFQNGGSGTGTVTLSGLTAGRSYQVQVFNYAADGDAGLTTLSGATPVTLNNLSGPGGNGQFATGLFTANGSTETFNWTGAGSAYTVLGAISVREMTAVVSIAPTNVVNQGDPVTNSVNAYSTGTSYYQWQTDNGSGGASWSVISSANASNYVVNTSALAVRNYEYRVIVTNTTLNVTSAPVTLTVLAPSAPVVLQNPTPASASRYVGQSTSFTAAFTGNHPIAYQWQFSPDGVTFQAIAGATNDIVTLNDLQLTNAGSYRLMATNILGSTPSAAATLTVQPWSAAQIQWSAPVPFLGMTAGQILTNISGSWLEGAVFFFDSFIDVPAGSQQFVFRSDGASASISSPDSFSGEFVTNAVYGSGAFGTNTTSDNNFDRVLNQYFDGGGTNLITLHNLEAGQQYSVQLFALDNRSGMSSNLVNFANGNDTNDVSATLAMGDNAYVVGTFTATGTNQVIQENLLTGGFGNINALVVRASSYAPSLKPAIVLQPRQRTSLSTHTADFSVVADGAPSLGYQWKAGSVGGPYTNLTDNAKFSGTTNRTLSVLNITTNDNMELVVAMTNSAGGGGGGAPVDLIVPPLAQPVAAAAPIRITCVGASDVSSPTPYGTPNWPDYITPVLGYEYAITNCGASGTTMLRQGNAPYWNTQQYTNSLNSSPDIVIIMLGSNDSKPYNWVYQTNYVHDYETLINEYLNLPSHPRLYLNTLLTVYGAGNYDITDPIVTGELCPIIKQIGFDENLPIIDVNAATKNMPQNFPDNVHPNIAGAKVAAQTVFNGLMSAGETPPMIDQALNKPVVASSVSNGNAATNAVDADYTTLWSSAPSDNQWIYVDLGSSMNITGVYLNWGANYGKTYKIQVSNDAVNWTDVYTNNAGIGGIDRIALGASGRYVRMLGIQSGTANGYSLFDFTITAVAASPTLSVAWKGQGDLNLSWPTSAVPFVVESTPSLAPPVVWTSVTNTIVNLNGTNTIVITPRANNLLFRLEGKSTD